MTTSHAEPRTCCRWKSQSLPLSNLATTSLAHERFDGSGFVLGRKMCVPERHGERLMPEQLTNRIVASSHVMVLGAGEAVFHRSDPSDGLYCVLSGAVRFGAIAASGRELLWHWSKRPSGLGKSRCSMAVCAPMMPGSTSPRLCWTCRSVT
jgi:hypothetical protein